MPHSRFSGDEIGDRGEAIYAENLRAQVEIPENIGKIISIDIETGDYELADDLLAGAVRLQVKHPDAAIYGKRIGYNAAVAVGGTLTRIVP
jgi:N12 class adenine-specific DNA methylase